MGRNAARLVEPPKGERPDIHPLTVEEARRLLAAALGLRQGELSGLRWEDVDLERGLLTVRHQLQRVAGRPELHPPRSAKGRRTLPLPALVREALRQHRLRQKEERLRAGPAWTETGFVFTTTVGTPLEARTLLRNFHGLLARARLPRRRFHDLRHTAASLLLALGVDVRVLQEILGHSQIGITANTYAHVLPPLLLDAAGKLDTLFGRQG